MSAGAFVYSKYESNAAGIYRIRTQPETIALSINSVPNAAPGGAINSAGTVRVSTGNREFGVKPRKVGIRFTSTLPTGYKMGIIIYVPVLTETAFNAYTPGQTGTYLANPVEVVGQSPERIR